MIRSFVLLIALLAFAGCGTEYRDTATPMKTVASVDLARYAGTWYEIARFPNWFERDCQATKAQYGPLPGGTVSVENTCRKGAVDGPIDGIKGVARATDASNARLKVKFGRVPFEGDYWVIYLDPDYRVAVVGTPAGTTGWILARTSQVTPDGLEPAIEALRANGYDVSRLEFVPQPGR